MKTLCVFLIACALPACVLAQSFQRKLSWRDNSFSSVSAEWVDIDNDSLLDVVLVGNDNQARLKIAPYKNSNMTAFTPRPSLTDGLAHTSFSITDVNRDNQMDILFSGTQSGVPAAVLFSNAGNFVFSKQPAHTLTGAASLVRLADLDQDGRDDLITAGTGLWVHQNTVAGFQLRMDSTQFPVDDMTARDFNHDGMIDLAVSGTRSAAPYMKVLVNMGNFVFQEVNITRAVAGIVNAGDFNHDGYFDLLGAGTNASGVFQIKYYRNDSLQFVPVDSLGGYASAGLLLADLNSDGLSDLSLSGLLPNGKRYNQIRDHSGLITDLDTGLVIQQRWGDFDRDGDLDILQVMDSASYHVFVLQENVTPEVNKSPEVPSQHFVVSMFDKTIIYWGGASDELTPASALTYDLLLMQKNAGESIVAPEFDFDSQKRMIANHGKQTTNRSAIIRALLDDRYCYLIQAVDNAFNGSRCFGGDVLPCFDLKHAQLQACKNDPVTLTASQTAYWFSTSRGFIKTGISLKFTAASNDTIFSVVPQGADCSKNNIWTFDVHDQSESDFAKKYVCENVSFKLGIAPGWKNVSWKIGSETATGDSITLRTDKPLQVSVTASNGTGCSYKRDFEILISKPVIALNGETFQIREGNSVTLQASGAQQYTWAPSSGLSDIHSAAPVASPSLTTEYTVTGVDSVGCPATAKVQVRVEATAFVATMFTPNGDGRNDDLRIYGLDPSARFRFLIYNREGSIVYETNDQQSITSAGWNGSHNGVMQPPGMYYWKVEGRTGGGESLKLNGRTKGSVLLVR